MDAPRDAQGESLEPDISAPSEESCAHSYPRNSSVTDDKPSSHGSQHQQVSRVPHLEQMMMSQESKDQQKDCYDNTDINKGVVFLGGEESEAVSEVNTGKGESIEIANTGEVQEPHTSIEEKSPMGAVRSQERVVPTSGLATASNIVTGDGKPRSIPYNVYKEKSARICEAVSDYYNGQFVGHWKEMSKREPGKLKVIAALLQEKKQKIKVVVLTAGTKHKTKCSYLMKNGDAVESSWGLCDGHAEAVCYRLASIYFLTEIYKFNENQGSIFEKTKVGYSLKAGVQFHLFTSHPPCGFMAKKERHFLSWKRPFEGKPHCLQCSSEILIGAYLGIQGSLSHLLTYPIYISSITIPRYETVTALHGTYINDRLRKFENDFLAMFPSGMDKSDHRLKLPHVEVVDVDTEKLFPECFRPYISEKPCNLLNNDQQVPQQETVTVAKQDTKGSKLMACATPDVIGNRGINPVVFTLEDGIGSDSGKYRESVSKLKSTLMVVPRDLKLQRLESLQTARKQLSQALNVSEALGVLKELITDQMKEKILMRRQKADEIMSLMSEAKEHKVEIGELEGQVSKLENSIGNSIKMNDLKSIMNALTHNLDYQVMLNDLNRLLETDKYHPGGDLDMMGCNWARYVQTICHEMNVKSTSFAD